MNGAISPFCRLALVSCWQIKFHCFIAYLHSSLLCAAMSSLGLYPLRSIRWSQWDFIQQSTQKRILYKSFSGFLLQLFAYIFFPFLSHCRCHGHGRRSRNERYNIISVEKINLFFHLFLLLFFSWSVQLIRNILSAPISPILIMIKRFRNDIARRKNTRQKNKPMSRWKSENIL